jgi:hypothetical protein
MEDKDIMAEVENLINEESKRIAEPTDAQSEGLVIFKNLIKEMDKDNPLKETQFYTIQVVDTEDAQEAIESGDGHLVSNGRSDTLDKENYQAGKVSLITDDIPLSKFPKFLGDLKTALVLSQWKEPAGLVARAKRNDYSVQAMVLGNILVFQKILPTGDKITKSWDTNTDEAPEPDQFDNKWDYKFLRNTYMHLSQPLMLKAQSPVMYDQIMDMVKEDIAEDIKEGKGFLGLHDSDDE